MESFENLLGPDAASGRAAIWAPAIGAPALSSGAKIVGAQVAALQLCIERAPLHRGQLGCMVRNLTTWQDFSPFSWQYL